MSETDKEKVNRVKLPFTSEFDNEFQKRANALARNFVEIRRCRECGNPVIRGYCCTYCDSIRP